MRLNALLVAAAVAISAVGFTTVNAQTGTSLDGYLHARVWTGVSNYDEDAGDDTDTIVGYGGGGTDFGIIVKKGNLEGKGGLETSYVKKENTLGNATVGVIYHVSKDVLIHWGDQNDDHLWYNTEAGWISPNDNGLREYAIGKNGACVSASAFGAYVAVYQKGYLAASAIDSGDTGYTGTYSGLDYTIPKVVAGYSMNVGPARVGLAGLFQQKTVDGATETATDEETGEEVEALVAYDGETLTSWAVTPKVEVMMGGIHGMVGAYYGTNVGDGGGFQGSANGAFAGGAQIDGDKISDTTNMGITAAFGYRMGNLEPAVGFGYRSYSNDLYEKDDTQMAYAFRLAYELMPMVSIQPGIVVTDYMDQYDGSEGGMAIQAGLFFEAMYN